MSEEPKLVCKSQVEIITDLQDASNTGRAIVPLLGAGISVEAGIPALESITHYLAKVQYYISQGGLLGSVYQNRNSPDSVATGKQQADKNSAESLLASYKHPGRYIQDFGWPDYYQMNAELWDWKSSDEQAPARRSLEWLVQGELVNDLKRLDQSLAERIREIQDQQRASAEGVQPLALKGNWRSLLAHLTDANPDYADTLFQMFTGNREPSTTHRFLAFLAPLMGFRLFLTTNFDDLLEEALRREGLHPIVYDVSRNSPLPHHSLIHRDLSVVKLHGGAFALRVGDTLDQPLDEESKARLQKYLPPRPILLVMGLGGWDRRVMDIVKLVLDRNRDDCKIGEAASEVRPALVYWMHFESECPSPVQDLSRAYAKGDICAVKTYHPGAFLMELSSQMLCAHPPSARPYSPQISLPIVPRGKKTDQEHLRQKLLTKSIYLFVDKENGYGLGASLELAQLAAETAASHIPIWIDLEEMQTVSEIVADIFRQIRKNDATLPPLAHEDGNIEKSVRRIYDALLRGRYLLAFNAVGSFGRPPTFHHRTFNPREDDKERDSLTDFLVALYIGAHSSQELPDRLQVPLALQSLLKDSILAFAIDRLEEKKGQSFPEFYHKIINAKSEIVECLGLTVATIRPARLKLDLVNLRDSLLLLAAFRRRRSVVALQQILPHYLPKDQCSRTKVADCVNDFVEAGYLMRVEGGYYWMSRRLRNEIYEEFQTYTSSDYLKEAIERRAKGGPIEAGDLCAPLGQLSSLVAVHNDLADYYYSSLFAASQDIQALLEHLYHRISSLRYLTKLNAWMPDSSAGIPENLLVRAAERLKRASSPDAWPEWAVATAHLRRLRLRYMLALRHVIERESERLLSAVPADTFLRWIDWIRMRDLPRFSVISCLKTKDLEARRNFQDSLDSPSAAGEYGERLILVECQALRALLDDLKASVLLSKLDFGGCMELRIRQLSHKLGRGLSPDCLQDPFSLAATVVEQIGQAGPSEQRRVVEWLGDILTCMQWRGELERAGKVRGLIEQVIGAAKREAESDFEPHICAMRIRSLRYGVDFELFDLSPWTLRYPSRGASVPGSCAERNERCERAIELCNKALETIEWATRDDYARNKSYFHSLKGRALYMRGDFQGAHREADLSQVGLSANVGADREALAASLLRLAECLMVRADRVIEGNGGVFSASLARAKGRLLRANEVLDRSERMLVDARQNLEWWVCLYQLRAQLQVEFLLLQVNSISDDLGGDRNQFIARFVSALRKGLRAIRQGLHVMLPGGIDAGSSGEPRDSRLTRFLRIWIELMICGGYLTLLVRRFNLRLKKSASADEQEAQWKINQVNQWEVRREELWKRWRALNESESISRLLYAGEFFHRVDPLRELLEDLRSFPVDTSATRKKIMAAVDTCLVNGAIAELVKAHKNGLGNEVPARTG